MKTNRMQQERVGGGQYTRYLFTAFVHGCLLAAMPIAAQDVLVPAGAVWKYLDNGTDQGTSWRGNDFNDVSWASGPAELGYGDSGEGRPEATRLSYGTNASAKYITTYFRNAFTVADPSVYTNLVCELVRDDGAVVYLNGREVFRSNMPGGAVNYMTTATANVTGAAEAAFYTSQIAASNLQAGVNVLAVEIHQSTYTSGDISFDLKLTGIRTPVVISLNAPENGGVDLPPTTTLNVTVTNTASSNVTVIFYGRVAAPSAGPDFSMVALPDTQNYVARINSGNPTSFIAQADWIVSNAEAQNIAFVTQLGDTVDTGDTGTNEWYWATNALYRLENPVTTGRPDGIPYGVAVGNHDQSPRGDVNGSTVFHNQFFGVEHFEARDYYGGHYGTNNDNHYEYFSASGMDFIVLHLEYDTTGNRAVLEWANQVLQSNATRRAILVSHYLMEAGVSASFSAQGRSIYENLKTNANLFLMLCGHVPGEGQRQETWNGHTTYTLMSDYQGQPNGGNGWLRVLEFSPSNNVIRVNTFSPTLGQEKTNASSQFELVYDMRDLEGFVALGTNLNVKAGESTAVEWSELAASTAYEWFVVAQDGTNITASPMWRFTTSANDGRMFMTGTGQRPTLQMQLDRVSGNLTFSWNSQPGTTYRIVSKDNILDTTWTDASTDLRAEGTTSSWSEPLNGSAPAKFYGIRIVE